MNINDQAVQAAFQEGHPLAVADQILIQPKPGTLVARVEALLQSIEAHAPSAEEACNTLIRLGMNFVGRDTEIVGYTPEEIEQGLERVLAAVDAHDETPVMGNVVQWFLADMRSVNFGDSLPGLLAERIEPELNADRPGRSLLTLLKQHMRSGIYWRMIGEEYCKFGNDFARGLEYLRHYGFCQVSTNPVLAAKAFDEDPELTEVFKREIGRHEAWLQRPEAHADEMAMAATLIALWPNLAIFRPLALFTGLRDYMVSFQLNPNIADQAEASIVDARHAYRLASEFVEKYDGWLGVPEGVPESDETVGPNIVFKVGAAHEAAREITTVLNSEGIGTNNTVVYTVAQEAQLMLDAFEGKVEALKSDNPVVRTYETNMGGRLVSHLREVEAEKLFFHVAEKKGEEQALKYLDALADSLDIDPATLQSMDSSARTRVVCAYKHLKSLDHPQIIEAAELIGQSAAEVKQLETDLKRAGTLVARRVYGLFYAPENRPKWVQALSKTHDISESQARWVLESMDVLPASKRVPEDTLDALGAQNMCHTEFPNHARAVQLTSEEQDFQLEDYRESILESYEPGVVERLYELFDFRRSYDLTSSLKRFIAEEVGIDVSRCETDGLKPSEWPDFGSVQKTSAEFKAAYDAFSKRCVEIAREVAETE